MFIKASVVFSIVGVTFGAGVSTGYFFGSRDTRVRMAAEAAKTENAIEIVAALPVSALPEPPQAAPARTAREREETAGIMPETPPAPPQEAAPVSAARIGGPYMALPPQVARLPEPEQAAEIDEPDDAPQADTASGAETGEFTEALPEAIEIAGLLPETSPPPAELPGTPQQAFPPAGGIGGPGVGVPSIRPAVGGAESRTKLQRLSAGFGIEANNNNRSGAAFGPVVALDWQPARLIVAGVRGSFSANFEFSNTLEAEGFVRLILPLKNVDLFLQGGAGLSQIFIYEGNSAHFLYDGGAGARIWLGRFYVEPQVRAGLPFLWSAGVTGGYQIAQIRGKPRKDNGGKDEKDKFGIKPVPFSE